MQKYKIIPKLRDEIYEDEEKEEEDDQENLYLIEKEDHNEYIFFLDIELDERKNFRKFYITCEKAKEKDIIKIIINSSGGKLGIFSQIFGSLINTKAKTISEIYNAHSASSFIWAAPSGGVPGWKLSRHFIPRLIGHVAGHAHGVPTLWINRKPQGQLASTRIMIAFGLGCAGSMKPAEGLHKGIISWGSSPCYPLWCPRRVTAYSTAGPGVFFRYNS